MHTGTINDPGVSHDKISSMLDFAHDISTRSASCLSLPVGQIGDRVDGHENVQFLQENARPQEHPTLVEGSPGERPTQSSVAIPIDQESGRAELSEANLSLDDGWDFWSSDQTGSYPDQSADFGLPVNLGAQTVYHGQDAIRAEDGLDNVFSLCNGIPFTSTNGTSGQIENKASIPSFGTLSDFLGGYFCGIPRANVISALAKEQYSTREAGDKDESPPHPLKRFSNSLQAQTERHNSFSSLTANLDDSSVQPQFSKNPFESPERISELYQEHGLSSDAFCSAFEDYRHVPNLPADTYLSICRVFSAVNADAGPYTPFTSSKFPSRDDCNAFMQTYFEEFHDTFPLVHKPTFNPARNEWLLTLAITALGMSFSRVLACHNTEKKAAYITWMQEFLRRAVQFAVGLDCQMLYCNGIHKFANLVCSRCPGMRRTPVHCDVPKQRS